MPIPQTIRVNPLDLQKNIAIGIGLPFNLKSVFTSTYTTKDQIKSNLVNLLLTDIGERPMNPRFGTNLRKFLFEGITDANNEIIIDHIAYSISINIPQINVLSITINPYEDNNLIELSIDYVLKISQTPDKVTLQFN
jgi:phage baseplate assembly protein W